MLNWTPIPLTQIYWANWVTGAMSYKLTSSKFFVDVEIGILNFSFEFIKVCCSFSPFSKPFLVLYFKPKAYECSNWKLVEILLNIIILMVVSFPLPKFSEEIEFWLEWNSLIVFIHSRMEPMMNDIINEMLIFKVWHKW